MFRYGIFLSLIIILEVIVVVYPKFDDGFSEETDNIYEPQLDSPAAAEALPQPEVSKDDSTP